MILLLGGMTVLTFVQVVLRYVFNTGWLWHLEATSYMFLWLVLIGICYGVRQGTHIGVDLLLRALPSKTQFVTSLIAGTVGLLYAGVMFLGSFNGSAFLSDFYQEWAIKPGYLDELLCLNRGYLYGFECLTINSEEIPIKEWIFYMILPVGFGLLILRIGAVWLGIFNRERIGFSTPELARGVEEIPQYQKIKAD